jgi:hypothetical protein
MPTHTRHRDPDARQESWLILYGDVHVGTIGLRSGNPFDTDQCQWRCGFYPGSEPGDWTSGTVASFDQARGDFELARLVFSPCRSSIGERWSPSHRGRLRRIPEAPRLDSVEIRDVGFGMQATHATSERRSRCFCGEVIDIKGMSQHVHVAHMESA